APLNPCRLKRAAPGARTPQARAGCRSTPTRADRAARRPPALRARPPRRRSPAYRRRVCMQAAFFAVLTFPPPAPCSRILSGTNGLGARLTADRHIAPRIERALRDFEARRIG